jgi:hypothetical protein
MKQEADTGFISEEKRGRIEIGLESELQGVKLFLKNNQGDIIYVHVLHL